MNNSRLSIGLPKMHLEAGERRVFLPDFVAGLDDMGFDVILDHEYGASIDLRDVDYTQKTARVQFGDQDAVYRQQYVLVLRYPGAEMLQKMPAGACLISMLHYPTRPQRIALLGQKDLKAISLDTIMNDSRQRLVENLASVAWNGLRISMQELSAVYPSPGFNHPQRPPIRVTLLGAGAVGKHVIQAAVAYGDPELRQEMLTNGVPGVMVRVVDYDLTGHPGIMREIFSRTDILVDATQRPDPSSPVIPNRWLAWLPGHAIITDLSVDPYLLNDDPPVVRGIEGIPQGSLDKYVYKADDLDWDLTVPASIPSDERRSVVSCYSWPGIFPVECMRHYGGQLTPLMRRLVRKGYDGISMDGDYFERALYRGTLRFWTQKVGKYN